tara:strand:+ start:26 stop:769 length:744 start_codon:yes stop_codon:yes gene_type:complete
MLLDDPIVQEPPHEIIVRYYESCIPYFIIDNFYTEKELGLIWNELNFLLDGNKFNPPEETGTALRKGKPIKKNGGIFLDNLYEDRKYSNILTVNRKLYQNFNNIISKCKSWWWTCISGSFNIITNDTTLVSYYENSDYYKSHWDQCMITSLTWFYKEPKVFEGGDLILNSESSLANSDNVIHPINLMGSPEKIKIKNNRMVLFPSMVPHQVTPVKIDSIYKNKGMGRFCITNFLNTSTSFATNVTTT